MLVAHEPVPPELLAQLARASGGRHRAVVRRAGRRPTTTTAAASSWCASPAATATRPIPTSPRTSSASCSHDQRARLSGAALETLAIVAYKQPISRAQIASIRGVDPDGVLRTLQGRGYIDAVGRDPGPGQAVLYGTTADVPREARARLASATCRRSPSSSPAPTWSRPSRPGCGRCLADAREPPLWTRSRRAPSGPRASGCRRCWRAGAGAAAASREELIAAGRVTVNGEVAVLGRRVDPDDDLVEVDGAPVGTQAGSRPLPAQQAGRGGDDGQGHARAPDGASRSCRPSRGSSRSAASTPTPRACCCSRTTASWPTASPTRATASTRSTSPTVVGGPGGAPGAIRRLRDGVELDDGRTAPAKVSQPIAGRAADHDPRGPQPPGAADVRGGRPPGDAPGADAHRSAPATAGCGRASGAPLTPDEVRRLAVATAGRRYDRTVTRSPATQTAGDRSSAGASSLARRSGPRGVDAPRQRHRARADRGVDRPRPARGRLARQRRRRRGRPRRTGAASAGCIDARRPRRRRGAHVRRRAGAGRGRPGQAGAGRDRRGRHRRRQREGRRSAPPSTTPASSAGTRWPAASSTASTVPTARCSTAPCGCSRPAPRTADATFAAVAGVGRRSSAPRSWR